MRSEIVFWNVVSAVLAVAGIAVPAYVAYDTDDPLPDPEKRLELVKVPGINPLHDLSVLRDRATITVTVGDETFDNLIITEALFKNTGKNPILPSEYHENLTVTVNAPWKIVTVENQGRFSFGESILLNWKRISDTSFEAEPALLNPGDQVSVRVYLTNTLGSGGAASREKDSPIVEWSARITNLREFSKPPDMLADISHTMLDMRGIIVLLYGWTVPFVIAIAIVFQAAYLYFLQRLDMLRGGKWRSSSLLIGISVLSFVAAESLSTYLFENWWTAVAGIPHWFNAPPLLLSSAILAALWWKTRPTEKVPLEAG
jgi:hypothetical protein